MLDAGSWKLDAGCWMLEASRFPPRPRHHRLQHFQLCIFAHWSAASVDEREHDGCGMGAAHPGPRLRLALRDRVEGMLAREMLVLPMRGVRWSPTGIGFPSHDCGSSSTRPAVGGTPCHRAPTHQVRAAHTESAEQRRPASIASADCPTPDRASTHHEPGQYRAQCSPFSLGR